MAESVDSAQVVLNRHQVVQRIIFSKYYAGKTDVRDGPGGCQYQR